MPLLLHLLLLLSHVLLLLLLSSVRVLHALLSLCTASQLLLLLRLQPVACLLLLLLLGHTALSWNILSYKHHSRFLLQLLGRRQPLLLSVSLSLAPKSMLLLLLAGMLLLWALLKALLPLSSTALLQKTAFL